MKKNNQITIDIPNSSTSAQEVIGILRKLVDAFAGSGTYLEDLFSPKLLEWTENMIQGFEDDPEIVGPGVNIAQLYEFAVMDGNGYLEQMKDQNKILMAKLREKKAQIFDLTFDDSRLNPYRGEEEIPF